MSNTMDLPQKINVETPDDIFKTPEALQNWLVDFLNQAWNESRNNPAVATRYLSLALNAMKFELIVDLSGGIPQVWVKNTTRNMAAADSIKNAVDNFVAKVSGSTTKSYYHDIYFLGANELKLEANLSGQTIAQDSPVNSFQELEKFRHTAMTAQPEQAVKSSTTEETKKKSWIGGLSIFGARPAGPKIGTHREESNVESIQAKRPK